MKSHFEITGSSVTLFTCILVILKLLTVINWSWLIVFSPYILYFVAVILIFSYQVYKSRNQ